MKQINLLLRVSLSVTANYADVIGWCFVRWPAVSVSASAMIEKRCNFLQSSNYVQMTVSLNLVQHSIGREIRGETGDGDN